MDSLTRGFCEGHAQKMRPARNPTLLHLALFLHLPLRLPLRLPLALALPLLLLSCSGYEEVILHDVKDIEVTRFDGKGVALRVQAEIENPNGFRISAVDPDVDLFLNGTLIGKGLLDSAIVLEKRSTKVYSIPMHAEFKGGSAMMLLLAGALAGEMEFSAKGTIAGKAGILRKRFPFELTETIDLGN